MTSLRQALLGAALVVSSSAHAMTFELEYGEGVAGVLNSTVTVGAAWRMQDRAADLVGKSNLNPGVCAGALQGCQGVFRDQTAPALALVNAPGQYTVNADDGNLNYDKGDLVQGVAKITQDLTLNYGDYQLFTRWLFFYDAVNNNFREYHPNRVTADNADSVGYGPGERDFIQGPAAPILQQLYFPDSTIYGPGGVVRNKRRNGKVLEQAGTDFQLLELYVSSELPLPGDRSLTWKVGRQTVNWGESTLLVINSVNQANPVNANNLFRVGFQLEEVFTPVGMLYGSTEVLPGWTMEAYYQFEWLPLEMPAPGTYMSFLDIGTDDAVDSVAVQFGGGPEDPDRVAHPQNNPLALIAGSRTQIERLPDNEASDGGQYGLSLKYYAENLGNGTEFGFYFMNYHSKLPYASFYATEASCLRRESAHGVDVTSADEFLSTCDDLPLNRILAGDDPRLAADSIAPLDTARIQLEYPENIKMLGVSFNTTLGDFSLQGEIAYRPDAPLQVDSEDLAFAAFGPTLSRCHNRNLNGTGCSGSSSGIGIDGQSYGPSDFLDADGNNPFKDTFDAGVIGTPVPLPGGATGAVLGHIPGSARSFPSFVIPYRYGADAIGENAPCARGLSTREYNSSLDCYIRGWEYFDTIQYNLGGTYVLGASDNPIGADQIILVGELCATHVPDLPSLDRLQIDAAGTFLHASAGADGSGADGSRQACSTNPSCHVGADGGRFNPHQQDLDAFADKFSWGYRVIGIIKYESVLPGISVQPFIVWSHDVHGTAPGPAENFIEGRKQVLLNVETRYKDALSFTAGYGWFTGAGERNLYRDRDFLQTYVKYQF
ncbi:MAG: DUF1302 domain-containing protein [Gammaproteobacteria bacterium]|nr:DUF1302 domain-containing protein [Gammaproteobacteria bacterium]